MQIKAKTDKVFAFLFLWLFNKLTSVEVNLTLRLNKRV